jgi:predicted nucleic acid-binding protein
VTVVGKLDLKNSVVIDAGVLALYFIDDTRVRPYFYGIDDGNIKGYMTHINLSEYYYKTCQQFGKDTADVRYLSIARSKIEIFADKMLARDAGLERCKTKLNLSIADCYALALSKKLKAILLTTDSELAKVKEVSVKHFKTD